MKKYAKNIVELVGILLVFSALDPHHAFVGCLGVAVIFIAEFFRERK